MSSFIKPPTLSTSFSESGKKAKKRFENILDTKAKKIGAISFAAILLLIGIMGALFGMGYNGYTYRNEAHGFELTIPMHWDGKCLIEENENGVSFYHTQTCEVYEFAGLLFHVERMEGTLSDEEVSDPGNRTVAMYANGYTYVFGMPTDVQYPIWSDGDAELNKKLAEEYLGLAKDLEKIKKSIKRIDITALPVSFDTQKLYKLKGTYTGDNSKVSAIVELLPHPQLPLHSIALVTDKEPYGITVNYKVDSRANHRFLDYSAFHKNAALMFSLIPNLGEIRFHLYDEYSDVSDPDTSFAGSYYNRQNLSDCPGMEDFTDEMVRAATTSSERFSEYYNKISAVFSDTIPTGHKKMTEIYRIIGNDCEITVNSGMGLDVTVTKELAHDSELNGILKPQNVHLEALIGTDISFHTNHIRNFKTNQATSYLFIYQGDNLIGHADLKSEYRDREVIDIIRSYTEDDFS